MSAAQLSGLKDACDAYYKQSKVACNRMLYDGIQKPAQACWFCDKALSPETVKKCSKCHVAIYCGQACQSRDWKVHKQPEGCPSFLEKFTGLSKFLGFGSEIPAAAQNLLKSTREAGKAVRTLQEMNLERSKEISEITNAIESQEKRLQTMVALKGIRASFEPPLPPVLQNLDVDLERAHLEEYRRLLSEMKAQHEEQLEAAKKIQKEWEVIQKL